MDQVAQVRDSTDIVSLITESVPLKNAGRNFKGLCPFHSEKTPSFVVSPERQIWHCFGCGKGGDSFTFLMEIEHVEFQEALRMLAKRAGITLVQSAYAKEAATQKEQGYNINSFAAEFYHYILTKHAVGKRAMEYLQKRGISEKTMNTFLVGFAPGVGSALSRYLTKKKKLPEKLLLETGLAFYKNHSLTDFFRSRIVFPLIDHRDNIVGFSGRTLEDRPDIPKYINTRDTPLYHKRDHFFGIHKTKDAIRKQNQAILVEGEFDVLSMFQEGISNVVAVKGTALTENQLALLSRYAQKVTICFDGDRAGREALRRSLPIIEKKGLTTTVIVLTNGKDPDEAIKNNAGEFKSNVAHEQSVYEYLLKEALAFHDASSVDGKKRISDELLPIFAVISNEIIKEHFLRKLSQELHTSYESVAKELVRNEQKETKRIPARVVRERRLREETMEEYLLALILQSDNPVTASEEAFSILTNVFEATRAHQKLLSLLASFDQTGEAFTMQAFAHTIPQELVQTFDTVLLFPLPQFQSSEQQLKEIRTTATQLKKLYIKEKLRVLTRELKTFEAAADEKQLEAVRQEYDKWLRFLDSG